MTAASLALTPVESEYVRYSLAERERRQTDEEARQKRERAIEQRSRGRLQALVAVLSVAAVVFLGLMIFALHQRRVAEQEAAIAHSLNLATGAQLSLNEGNTDIALTLAMEANRMPDPPPQAQLMLADAAYAPGARRVFLGHDGAVEDVVLTSDGDQALSASADGTLIFWGLETGELIRRFSGHEDAVHAVAFLPSGDQAISASADGTLILWDVETGEVVRRFSGHSGEVLDVAVSLGCDDAGCGNTA